jgi:hypothetical protein
LNEILTKKIKKAMENLTPQEKAQHLFDKIYLIEDTNEIASMREDNTKTCAIIVCEEILKLNLDDINREDGSWTDYKNYWLAVKTELETNF